MHNPQQEIEKLQLRIKELENEIEHLSISPSYNVLTRGAIERKWLSIDKTNKSIILFDIDHLHHLNEEFGHEEMNRRISLGLDCVRSCELLGLVYSGDEFVLVVNSTEETLVVNRIKQSFNDYGITLTIALSSIENEINQEEFQSEFQPNYQKLVSLISQNKSIGLRNSVTYLRNPNY